MDPLRVKSLGGSLMVGFGPGSHDSLVVDGCPTKVWLCIQGLDLDLQYVFFTYLYESLRSAKEHAMSSRQAHKHT